MRRGRRCEGRGGLISINRERGWRRRGGVGGGGAGGAAQFVRGNYISFKEGGKSDGFGKKKMHQFIMGEKGIGAGGGADGAA